MELIQTLGCCASGQQLDNIDRKYEVVYAPSYKLTQRAFAKANNPNAGPTGGLLTELNSGLGQTLANATQETPEIEAKQKERLKETEPTFLLPCVSACPAPTNTPVATPVAVSASASVVGNNDSHIAPFITRPRTDVFQTKLLQVHPSCAQRQDTDIDQGQDQYPDTAQQVVHTAAPAHTQNEEATRTGQRVTRSTVSPRIKATTLSTRMDTRRTDDLRVKVLVLHNLKRMPKKLDQVVDADNHKTTRQNSKGASHRSSSANRQSWPVLPTRFDTPSPVRSPQRRSMRLPQTQKEVSQRTSTAYKLQRNKADCMLTPSTNSTFKFRPSVVRPDLAANYRLEAGLAISLARAHFYLRTQLPATGAAYKPLVDGNPSVSNFSTMKSIKLDAESLIH